MNQKLKIILVGLVGGATLYDRRIEMHLHGEIKHRKAKSGRSPITPWYEPKTMGRNHAKMAYFFYRYIVKGIFKMTSA